jgi:ficolin
VLCSFWLGLEAVHQLSSRVSCTLRVDLEDVELRRFGLAMYTTFTVDKESENYRLSVGGYSGDAGDSLASHNGMAFSTFDRDNDVGSLNCAAKYHGAWWYANCYFSNLNGESAC